MMGNDSNKNTNENCLIMFKSLYEQSWGWWKTTEEDGIE
jgi:hypothetical protein